MRRPEGRPTIVFAGGGTGGHLFPGIAVAEALRGQEPDARILLAATSRDTRAPHGIRCPFEIISTAAPRRPGGAVAIPLFGVKITSAVARAYALLRSVRPDVVVGLGGYGSVPLVVAARLMNKPVLLLEQNAVPGRATRALSRLGTLTATSYPRTASRGVRGAVIHTGNPVRSSILEAAPAHEALGLEPGVPVLAVLGGSLGARGLNLRLFAGIRALVRALAAPGRRSEAFQVIHATGDRKRVHEHQAVYRRAGIPARVRAFFHDMGAVYGTADAVLSRAGGTTVAEITAVGLPAVFVPYPYHTDDHQVSNARAAVEAGAATMVREHALTPQELVRHVAPLLEDPALRERRATRARRLGRPEAAERVVDLVLELAAGPRRRVLRRVAAG